MDNHQSICPSYSESCMAIAIQPQLSVESTDPPPQYQETIIQFVQPEQSQQIAELQNQVNHLTSIIESWEVQPPQPRSTCPTCPTLPSCPSCNMPSCDCNCVTQSCIGTIFKAIAYVLVYLLAIGPFIALALAQIILGGIHKNDIICDPSYATHLTPVVEISTWLIVDGVMQIFIVIIISLLAISKIFNIKSDNILIVFIAMGIPIGIFVYIFKFVWLIVGSIAFWRDCSDLDPKSVNDITRASLIIGYVLVGLICFARNINTDK